MSDGRRDENEPTLHRWRQVEELFHRALDLDPNERRERLNEWCGDDLELRHELDQLLAAEQQQVAVAPPADRWLGRTLGHFRLERWIGQGGMGAVYYGQRIEGDFQQQVAVKIIGARFTTGWLRDQFLTERAILARLQHPNIAQLLDGGVTDDGEPYLVMEHVEGERFDKFCENRKAGTAEILKLFLQVCSAVAYSHRNLVVHRDLKPANILVTASGFVKLLDFGTARVLDPAGAGPSQATRFGMRALTPEYASPEQMFGEPVSVVSDVYSLGVVLYRLLTGKLPFNVASSSQAHLMRTLYDTQPPTPSQAVTRVVKGAVAHSSTVIRVEDLRGDLDAIVLKALRPLPADRYASVDDLAADIENHIAHRPVRARAGGYAYLAGKFARRHRAGVAAGVLATIALAAGVVTTTVEARVASAEAERAAAGFEHVRRLSNLLLLDLNDQVKQLPGSTEVQRRLVNMGVSSLDRLAREAPVQPQMQLDLLRAYTRLGNLQGNPYEQNLGDAKGALATFAKAEPISRLLDPARDASPEVLRELAGYLRSRAEVLLAVGRTSEAVQFSQQAAAALDQLVSAPNPAPADLSEAAGTYDSMGDMLGLPGVASFGDVKRAEVAYQKALAYQQRALQIDPQHRRAMRGVVICRMKIANTKQESDPAEAVKEYRAALTARAALPADLRESMNLRRLEAMLNVKLGNLLPEVDRAPEALAPLEQACHFYAAMVAADKQDTRARFDAATCHYHRAMAYRAMNKDGAARPELMRVIELLDDVLQRDPGNNAVKGPLATALYDAGSIARKAGIRAEGDKQVRRALDLAVAAADHLDSSANDMIRAANMLVSVEPVEWRDPAKAVAFARHAVDNSGGNRPTAILALVNALKAKGDRDAARKEAERGLALLTKEPSRLRASFQEELDKLSAR